MNYKIRDSDIKKVLAELSYSLTDKELELRSNGFIQFCKKVMIRRKIKTLEKEITEYHKFLNN